VPSVTHYVPRVDPETTPASTFPVEQVTHISVVTANLVKAHPLRLASEDRSLQPLLVESLIKVPKHQTH
jgi:hypothetical protein